jgi:DNA-binding SARP family transcriptional activator
VTALMPNGTDVDGVITGKCYLAGGLELPGGLQVPTAKKPRQILALLLAEAGKSINAAALASELWGEETPRSYVATLQTHILHVRHSLGDNKRERSDRVLSTTNAGYCLNIRPEQVDVLQFFAATRTIRLEGNETERQLHDVMARLEAAFALLRGPLCYDVSCGSRLERLVQLTKESHRLARRLWVKTALKLGMFHEILSVLTMLSRDNPVQEDFARWHMLDLYCCGRSADALSAYQRLRSAMISQLGIEPGPQTKHLHAKILNGDSALLRDPQYFV